MPLALTVGTTTLALPDNLLWADELEWEPVLQTVTLTFTGVPLVEEWPRLGSRPITYRGGQPWVRVTRTALLTLRALLDPLGTIATLTHHDGRTFRVVPRRGGEGAIIATPWPVIADSGAANPSGGAYYTLDEIRFLEVPP